VLVDQAKVGFGGPKAQQRTITIGRATNIEYLLLMGIRGCEIVASGIALPLMFSQHKQGDVLDIEPCHWDRFDDSVGD
jgi:hypothetical protein